MPLVNSAIWPPGDKPNTCLSETPVAQRKDYLHQCRFPDRLWQDRRLMNTNEQPAEAPTPGLDQTPTFLLIKTPTELDLRELFTLGLTSKRDGSKIGHKGSGLKFALALIHRLGSHLVVRVGHQDLRSVTVVETIRGHDHKLIRLIG